MNNSTKLCYKFLAAGAAICLLARAYNFEYFGETISLSVAISFFAQICGGAVLGGIAWLVWKQRRQMKRK